MARSEGIELIGNYFNRVAVHDCIYNSMKTAVKMFDNSPSRGPLLAMKF